MAIAPDFDDTLAGSYTPDKDGGSSRDKIVAGALEPVWKSSFYGEAANRRGSSTPSTRALDRLAGPQRAGAATTLSGRGRHRRVGHRRCCDRIKSAERQGCVCILWHVPFLPFLTIASEGDGAVPLKFVRERFPADVKNIEVGAAPSNWPRRGVIAAPARTASVSRPLFLAPDVNVEMQNFLGPLLPVARFLKIPVLDF